MLLLGLEFYQNYFTHLLPALRQQLRLHPVPPCGGRHGPEPRQDGPALVLVGALDQVEEQVQQAVAHPRVGVDLIFFKKRENEFWGSLR